MNNIFSMRYKGPTAGDCMAPYYVDFKKVSTVREFIEAVLKNTEEWGYIGICSKDNIFGSPNNEFRYGKADISNDIEKYLDSIIIGATAHGGWSRMDYLLEVENERTV